jgi:hypothetical protein
MEKTSVDVKYTIKGEQVHVNTSTGLAPTDNILPFEIRRQIAELVNSGEFPAKQVFSPIYGNSQRRQHEGKLIFDGVAIPIDDYPESWEDYNVYMGNGSHLQMCRAALGHDDGVYTNGKFAEFSVHYVTDQTGRRIFLASIRQSVNTSIEVPKNPNPQEMEAILRATNASYFYGFEDAINRLPFSANPYAREE